MDQSDLEANTCNLHQARENACERGTVGFSFGSHWLRKWCKFCYPITEPIVKLNQSKREITFDSNLKTALSMVHFGRYLSAWTLRAIHTTGKKWYGSVKKWYGPINFVRKFPAQVIEAQKLLSVESYSLMFGFVLIRSVSALSTTNHNSI